MTSTRKLFHNNPFIRSIERSWQFCIGFIFERGGYEGDDVTIVLGLLFIKLYISFRKSIYTTKQRTFGIMIAKDHVLVGYGKAGNWIEGETATHYWYRLMADKLLGKKKYHNNEQEIEHQKSSIRIPDMDGNQIIEHHFRYAHCTARRKRKLLPASIEKYTRVIMSNCVLVPGKGTCGHNQEPDGTTEFAIKGHVSLAEIHKRIAGDAYFYRVYYPL